MPFLKFIAVITLCLATLMQATPSITIRQSDRIVIVGGGPAGVHYASLLAKKGFTNITVLEAANQVGGKSRTEFDHRGRPQEMGTVFALDTYTPIFDLVDEYDRYNSVFEFSFQKPGYMAVMGQSIGANDTDPNVALDFPHYLMQSIQQSAPHALQPKATVPQLQALFMDQAKRYIALHRSIFGTYPYGMPPQPKDWQLIDMTAMEFLTRNNLTALVGMFRFSQQQQGYGVLETIPAFYLLWWSHPDAVANIMKAQVEHRSCAYELSNGFQSLWIKMMIAHKPVVTTLRGVNVTSVSRGLKTKTSPSVTYAHRNGTRVTIACDHVVMAVDLSVYASLVVDMTADELAFFTRSYTASAFSTTVFESNPSPVETAAVIWPLRVSEDGRLSALRNAKLTMVDGDATNWGNLTVGRQVRVAYQFYNKPVKDVNQVMSGSYLYTDLRKGSMTNPAVWTQLFFNYFPRFTPEGLRSGLPWKIWNAQGQRKTTWIGSSVCFESVLDVVTYNNNLIQYVEMTK